jgi:hypothetical protein
MPIPFLPELPRSAGRLSVAPAAGGTLFEPANILRRETGHELSQDRMLRELEMVLETAHNPRLTRIATLLGVLQAGATSPG